jgi:hypothetical protein
MEPGTDGTRCREPDGVGARRRGAWSPAAMARGVGSLTAPVHGCGRARTWGRRKIKK